MRSKNQLHSHFQNKILRLLKKTLPFVLQAQVLTILMKKYFPLLFVLLNINLTGSLYLFVQGSQWDKQYYNLVIIDRFLCVLLYFVSFWFGLVFSRNIQTSSCLLFCLLFFFFYLILVIPQLC